MINLRISTIFANIAELAKQKDGNQKTVMDFTRAARTIRDFPGDLKDAYINGILRKLPGIIPDVYKLIEEYFKTGSIGLYDELKADYSEELIKFIRISGLGKRRIFAIYESLGAKDLDELKERIREEGSFSRILKSPNIGKDLVTEIHLKRLVHSLDYYESTSGLFPKGYINFFIDKIKSEIIKLKDVKNIEVTGSIRRKKAFVRDIDILILTNFNLSGFNIQKSNIFLQDFKKLTFIKSIKSIDLRRGNLSARFDTTYGVDIEVVISSGPGWEVDLFYTTGSKNHVRKIEEIALKRGLLGNHGIDLNAAGFIRKDHNLTGAKTSAANHPGNFSHGIFLKENENRKKTTVLKNYEEGQDTSDYLIYENLGLERIPPELREDKGEVELAKRYALPKLIKLSDIKGDLHVHSSWSDGIISLEDIIKSCRKYKYEYLAISDHSISNLYGNGLDTGRMLEKIDYIKGLRQSIKDFDLLIGGEVDIRGVSMLDYDESILKKMDIALASMHSNYLNTVEENTSRITGAIKNSMIDAIAHPTGVVFGARAPYEMKMEQIFEVAVKYNKALEINSYLLRLDLNDSLTSEYKKMGGKVVINTDSHRATNLDMIVYGVEVARRAGLEKDDVINTKTLKELKQWKRERKMPG